MRHEGLSLPTREEGPAELLRVEDLRKTFDAHRGFFGQGVAIHAVNGVSFAVNAGEVFGLVGESGCGKSTTARLVLRLLDPTSGKIYFEGEDITGYAPHQMMKIRRSMQVVFQDPLASLNARMTVEDILSEPFVIHRVEPPGGRKARIRELLELVGLRRDALRRRPLQFSGGQQQRIAIARALALNPKMIVADEPVSALDVSIQAQILNLFMDLREVLHISFLFISHNLGVVRHISDRVAVMYLGGVVELARAHDLYAAPKHPYTKSLLSAVPVPNPDDERLRKRIPLSGDPPRPSNLPSGCPFHPRCWKAADRCSVEAPALRQFGDSGHHARCHFPE